MILGVFGRNAYANEGDVTGGVALIDIVEKVKYLNEVREEAFLATIVNVEGSAYRREGAKMVFTLNDEQFGTLSAGCLEQDLALRIREVIASGRPQIYSYDMRSDDDLLWGMGSGCNGKIDIFVEPIAWNWVPPFHHDAWWPQVESVLRAGSKLVVVRTIQGEESMTLGFTEGGNLIGSLGNRKLDNAVKNELRKFLQTERKSQQVYLQSLSMLSFVEVYQPKERLFVFGAGIDAEPVVEMASKLGFDVTLIDPRPGRCNKRHFPGASRFIVSQPHLALSELNMQKKDYALLMTHNFNQDLLLLRDLVQNHLEYLGVLGPLKRTARILGANSVPQWIHSPVGLEIGAEGPEEIAISIIAQLIAVRHQMNAVAPNQPSAQSFSSPSHM